MSSALCGHMHTRDTKAENQKVSRNLGKNANTDGYPTVMFQLPVAGASPCPGPVLMCDDICLQVLENGTDYNSVQKQLAQTPLMAPVYFILGGTNSSQVRTGRRGHRAAAPLLNCRL